MFKTIILSVALLASMTLAGFSQGSLNLTRDYHIEYASNVFSSTPEYCSAFRERCIVINGMIDQHHQLDCLFKQSGPQIYAFCGGVRKNPDGSNPDKRTAIVYDHTQAVVNSQLYESHIVDEPLGKAGCEGFARAHRGKLEGEKLHC